MAREREYDYAETEYERAIKRLGWSQVGAARTLGIDPRTSRRYVGRDLALPDALQRLLRVAVHLGLSEDDFSPEDSHVDTLIRAIYRHKIPESKYFELIATPIR